MTTPTHIIDKRSFKIFDQSISVLSFGGSLYVPFEQDGVLHDFKETIACAFNAGINHFDTAQSYHAGQGERVFAECLGQLERKHFLLASKMLLTKSRDEAIEGVNASLKNLRTEYLDIFYIHWPAGKTDPRPMMEGLEECRKRGLIRGIGASNFSVEQLEVLQQAGTVDIVQLCFNLLWRKHEKDLIPYCMKNGIGIISYSSLAQGILTGKYQKDYLPGADDARKQSVFFRDDVWPVVYKAVSEMQHIADESGIALVELAIKWLLRQKSILSILVGARSSEQILRNIRAASGSLDNTILKRLTQISDTVQDQIPDTGNIFQYYPE